MSLVTEHTFAARCERIARASDLALDLETTGLRPWKGDRLCGVAIEVDGEADYFPFRHEAGGNLPIGLLPNLLDALLLVGPEKTYGGWSVRFDLTTLAYEPTYRDRESFLSPALVARDGMIDALLMNENEPSFSLASIAKKYLGEAATKDEMDAILAERFPEMRSARARKGNLWRLHASEVAPYACGDVILPRRLRPLYDKALDQWGLTNLCREMNAYSLLLARMQVAGVPIDVARCRRLSESTEVRKADLLRDIRLLAGPAFNPNSPLQVPRLLKTPDSKEATLRLSGHPLAQRIIDYRKLGKAKAAYYDAILDLVDDDGVLHPQLNLTADPSDTGGTKTGRLSCSQPNFQALPRADEDPNAIYQVRDLVVPPSGCKIAKLDYERIEMWVGAGYCKEPRLIAAYHEGRDIYNEMAADLKITRRAAKIVFLALQYGCGPWKLALMLGCTEDKARAIRDGFFGLYPNIKRAIYAYADAWEGTGSVRLWTGRVCHYPGERAYAAWNRQIQGAVGEMVRVAMQRMEAPLARLGARMVLSVHDEIVVIYPAANEVEVLGLCRREMTGFDSFMLRPRVAVGVSAENYARAS